MGACDASLTKADFSPLPVTWYEPLLNTLLSALVGAAVVAFFAVRQLQIQRRLSFRDRQLTEFYAPLAGIRKQIRAKSELRVKISDAANGAWQEICRASARPMLDHERRFAPFKKITEYENDQLKADPMLLPTR